MLAASFKKPSKLLMPRSRHDPRPSLRTFMPCSKAPYTHLINHFKWWSKPKTLILHCTPNFLIQCTSHKLESLPTLWESTLALTDKITVFRNITILVLRLPNYTHFKLLTFLVSAQFPFKMYSCLILQSCLWDHVLCNS